MLANLFLGPCLRLVVTGTRRRLMVKWPCVRLSRCHFYARPANLFYFGWVSNFLTLSRRCAIDHEMRTRREEASFYPYISHALHLTTYLPYLGERRELMYGRQIELCQSTLKASLSSTRPAPRLRVQIQYAEKLLYNVDNVDNFRYRTKFDLAAGFWSQSLMRFDVP